MGSKLFTPSNAGRLPDCFVNPFTKPEGQIDGFAPGEDGGALYPLRLGGAGGKSISLMPPKSHLRSTDDKE